MKKATKSILKIVISIIYIIWGLWSPISAFEAVLDLNIPALITAGVGVLMLLAGIFGLIGMKKINFVYIIQNGIIGFISTILAFICSRLCLMLMGGYVASMGIVLDTAKIYPLEIAIMAVVFVISVLPTVVCTLNMSKKDGITE